WNQNRNSRYLFDAFSSREPESTSLENASIHCSRSLRQRRHDFFCEETHAVERRNRLNDEMGNAGRFPGTNAGDAIFDGSPKVFSEHIFGRRRRGKAMLAFFGVKMTPTGYVLVR